VSCGAGIKLNFLANRKHLASEWVLTSGMSLFRINRGLGSLVVGAVLFGVLCAGVYAETTNDSAAKLLPTEIGAFRQKQPAKPSSRLARDGLLRPEYYPINSDPKALPTFVAAESRYSSGNQELAVELVRFQTDSEAYALLTLAARGYGKPSQVQVGAPGLAHFFGNGLIGFSKGTTFALIADESAADQKALTEFAGLLAAKLDAGEDDLPVLIKHLPDWEHVSGQATYATSLVALREAVPNQAVLNALSFEGGTEAVVAHYGQSQLVIVEFTTPQFSIDNDQKVWTTIAELKTKGEPVPSAYRRIGNYSVFVFNAADEKAANALIDQVKYEKVVQWLGEDPHLYERLQKYFTQTSAGVLVAVLKSSGLSLLLCLAAGALIGTMMFRYRRAQRAAAYSDAGGSIRLNLDELTTPIKTQRLLDSARPAPRNSKDI
jgi:hypothetical protein